MRKTIKVHNFKQDRIKGQIECSITHNVLWFCGKSTSFSLHYTNDNLMVFECNKCRKRLLIPFRAKVTE